MQPRPRKARSNASSRHRHLAGASIAVLMVLVLAGCGSTSAPTPLVLGPSATDTLEPGVGATFARASLSTDGPPIATVLGASIGRQEWADRVQLIRFRYERERIKLQHDLDAGTIDQASAQERLMDLGSRAADAEAVAVDDLVDLAYQTKLAHDEGLSVTPAEVDAAQVAETAGDATFVSDLTKTVSATAYRRNLEAETLSAKLRDEIIRKATSDSVEQVHLSDIFLQSVTGSDETADSGAIRASQILFAPNHDPNGAVDLPSDDPAWARAQADAQTQADALRAIADLKQRSDKFAEIAKSTSDDEDTGPDGGDLGWISPDQLEEPEASTLFDQQHAPGDIVGPLQSSFGWVVDLYVERRPPLSERVAKVQQRLAVPGADFATIAREESDGDEASAGGDLGWIAPFETDPLLQTELKGAPVDKVIGPLTLDDGVHFYKVDGRETRTLSPDQHQQLQDTAFDDWYQNKREAAMADGEIVIPDTSP